MDKKQWLKIGLYCGLLCCLIVLTYELLKQNTLKDTAFWRKGQENAKEILFFDETPIDIIFAAKSLFPEYKIRKEKERHLAQFLAGSSIILAYDVQAWPFIEDMYFYPLYEDAVIIAVDQKRVSDPIAGWHDLESSSYNISLPEKEPQQRYLWMAISYGLSQQIIKETAKNYLSGIYEQGRLFWNNWTAPIQITFHSTYLDFVRQNRKTKIVYPQEGSLSFRVGLLSHDPLPLKEVEAIRSIYRQMGYITVADMEEVTDLTEQRIQPVINFFKEHTEFGEVTTAVNRDIKKRLKYAPNTGVEHQVVALLIIIVIVLGISYVYKTVIHLGVRRGVIITGFILIGWILTGVFKYSFYGNPDHIRILWYSYYFFLLMLPPTALYIAANIDRWDKVVFPGWLLAAWVFSILLTIMILSNDVHQLAFRFLVSDKNLWHKYYRRNIGYYLVAFWMTVVQAGTWIYLVRKSWDSPKRKMAILPILVLVMGIVYSLMYNLQVSFFRNIPLVLGMSTIVVLFWVALLKSGLIPSNYGYHKLFENGQLEMKILDLEGKLRFQSAIAEFDMQKERDMKRPFFIEEDSLIWSTDIRGGTIVTKEDISELSGLKRDLESVTKELEQENKILSEKEQVKSKLILLREQNKLTEEVNWVVEDKIKKMKQQLQQIRNSKENPGKGLMQLQRLAIYCKRRCELLIKSKQHMLCSAQDIARLIDEINSVSAGEYSFFFGLEDGLPFSLAVEAYECYHLFCDLAAEENIDSMTARLLKEEEEVFLYFLAEGSGERLWKKLAQAMTNSEVISYKNMGDAFSIIICLKGEGHIGK
ncbi:hypothetical protein EII17_06610 [Clostridiales bacterium COT073_COT-073]|nr:hypothetical protein EII17_06610 [Clostridiales bacterium COT073_COT-073]